ncbi:MAG: hypoxanthine phosphoribosyltransferase [Candidatus Lindowbacteria bacterium RIFCSPLOWO2_12_FULL_62_27]|nr:MAG: hypoxanthine phosphoribosyltransferase [Candidatus Lindowbacteria bacterium RIFCSPLOWO2_02_FULL_62_12]OGH60796.1 MAG: hypoxanthine phosphoribosyltransferase [Candidatus Lindowbacteria bacterium RIFCSPLOWO2_12_FULL_62_27]
MTLSIEEVKDRVVFDEAAIAAAVRDLGRRISQDYANQELLLVGILRGAYVFLSDLSRAITIPHVIDFMAVSSYGSGSSSSGVVRIETDLRQNVEGRHVLIVEDIIDTGLTYSQLKKTLEARHPRSVKICALLDKPTHRKVPLVPDYAGLVVPDLFLVGYGLDYLEYFRGIPYIFSVNPNALKPLEAAGKLI